MKTKIFYFTENNLSTPIPHLRLLGPSDLEDFEVHSIDSKEIINETIISKCKLILLDRDTPRNYERFREILKFAHMLEIPIVYDIDDYLFELPKNHPDRESFIYTRSLLPTFEALLVADYVTVSTEKLRETLKNFNRNIYVLPNFLDDSLWPFHLPIQRKKTKSITIGYMGGESHKPDIEWIIPVLEEINQRFIGELNFHFYGVKPPEKFLSLPNVNHTSIMTYNYREFINDFHLLDVDIFIAPLIDNLFNQCKSPIKYFEYTTMGVPGVFSNVEPYQKVIIDGENGLLAKSLDDWDEKLVTLIQEPDLRYKLAYNAQKAVVLNWLMSKNAHIWTETYKNFIQIGSQQSINSSLSEMIGSISLQLHEYHQHQNKIVAEKQLLKSALEEKEKKIQTQTQQLVDQKNVVHSFTEKLDEQKKSAQILRDQLTEQNKSIQVLNQTIEEKEKIKNSLSNQLTKQELLYQSLKNRLEIKESELSSLKSQLEEKEQTINTLKHKIKYQTKELLSSDSQLTEKIQIIKNLNKLINQQNDEMVLLQARHSELEEEILFYSLSKSWRLTRPLRKLMSLFKGKQDV